MAEKWVNGTIWEFRKQFYALRYLLLGYLILDLLIWVLPVSSCGLIAKEAFPAVILVSYLYAAGVAMIILYPALSMTFSGHEGEEEMEQMAGMGGEKRILTRIPVNLAIVSLFYLNSLGGEILMRKFADETHSYFALDIYRLDTYQIILIMGFLFPVIYYGFYLIYRKRGDGRHPFLAYLTAAVVLNVLMSGTGLWGVSLFAVFMIGFCLWRGRRQGG